MISSAREEESYFQNNCELTKTWSIRNSLIKTHYDCVLNIRSKHEIPTYMGRYISYVSHSDNTDFYSYDQLNFSISVTNDNENLYSVETVYETKRCQGNCTANYQTNNTLSHPIATHIHTYILTIYGNNSESVIIYYIFDIAYHFTNETLQINSSPTLFNGFILVFILIVYLLCQ